MIGKLGFVSLLVFGLFVFIPVQPLSAQACTGCFECGPEKVSPSWGSSLLWFAGCAYGPTCDGIPCGEGDGDPPQDPGTDADAEELAMLLEQPDSKELLRFAVARAYIEYVPGRNAFAVRGCSGALVALLPIPVHHNGVGIEVLAARIAEKEGQVLAEPAY